MCAVRALRNAKRIYVCMRDGFTLDTQLSHHTLLSLYIAV